MDPQLSERLGRYDAWFERAERHIDSWFDAGERAGPEEPVDHRSLSSVVTTLRRVIEGRRILHEWIENVLQPAAGTTEAIDDAEFSRIVEDCAAGGANPLDEDKMPD